MSAKLQATEKQLTMEMKKHSVEEGLSQRPSPEELKGKLPAVYDSLSEEAKEASINPSCSPLFRVYTSLIMATAKQLALASKVGFDCLLIEDLVESVRSTNRRSSG